MLPDSSMTVFGVTIGVPVEIAFKTGEPMKVSIVDTTVAKVSCTATRSRVGSLVPSIMSLMI